jgi:hypothetical protein
MNGVIDAVKRVQEEEVDAEEALHAEEARLLKLLQQRVALAVA